MQVHDDSSEADSKSILVSLTCIEIYCDTCTILIMSILRASENILISTHATVTKNCHHAIQFVIVRLFNKGSKGLSEL